MHATTAHSAAVKTIIRRIADRLAEASADELVTHEQLRALVPGDLRRPYHTLVIDAKKLVNREYGAIFATVRKEGYRRLDRAVGVEYAGSQPMGRIRKLARRSRVVLGNAVHHANDLTPSQRRAAFQSDQVLGMVEHLTHRNTIKTMPEEPAERADALAGLRQAIGRT